MTTAKFLSYDESTDEFEIDHEEAGILNLPADYYQLDIDEESPHEVIGKTKEMSEAAESFIYGIG